MNVNLLLLFFFFFLICSGKQAKLQGGLERRKPIELLAWGFLRVYGRHWTKAEAIFILRLDNSLTDRKPMCLVPVLLAESGRQHSGE